MIWVSILRRSALCRIPFDIEDTVEVLDRFQRIGGEMDGRECIKAFTDWHYRSDSQVGLEWRVEEGPSSETYDAMIEEEHQQLTMTF